MRVAWLCVVLVLVSSACTNVGDERDPTDEVLHTDTLSKPIAVPEPVADDRVVEEAVTDAEPGSDIEEDLPSPPWSEPFVDSDAVDVVLLDAWSSAPNREFCALLAPIEMGPGGERAVARRAGFPPYTDWMVAWDNPDGPGMTGDSQLCEDCGRSAFGIHGTDWVEGPPRGSVAWADGSRFGIANQGGYADGHKRVLAELRVAGQPCVYNVWSSLGEDHLRWLVNQLRFVVGHHPEPISKLPLERAALELGDPPWTLSPLSPDDVDDLLLDLWADAPASGDCPLTAFADLGDGASQAVIRPVLFDQWGVAWDNPSGRGHDGFNEPCSNCGRGVIGLSGGWAGQPVREAVAPNTVVWDDGSTARYGYDGLLYNVLPPDRIHMQDSNTGDPTRPPIHAWINPTDHPGCVYEMWTHLGEDHLLYLMTQLRYVEDHP